MKYLFFLLLMVEAFVSTAQQKTFDIIKYTVLKGWKEEQSANGSTISYSKVDQKTKTWCRINMVMSTASKGNIEDDFKSEWKLFAVDQYNATGLQENEVQDADGWKVKAGGGKFVFNNQDAMVLLATMSGYNVCVSCVITTNSQDYMDDIAQFLQSLDLIKPAVADQHNNTASQPAANPAKQNAAGFTFTTSNFDDGWTSTEYPDYVMAVKGNIKVLIHYAVQYNDETRKDITGGCWNMLAANRYEVKHFYYPDTRNTYLPVYFLQADVVEKSTGKPKYISFLVESNNGTGSSFEVVTDSRADYEKTFPSLDALRSMAAYNKFALAPKDVVGSWIDGGTETAQWYYTSAAGGGYAGMSVAATSSQYNFNVNGTYTSTHKGATGFVGALNTYQQEYKGKYSVTNWSVTATNRFEGKTDNYNAWFQSVRGGRILHLQNKQYTGQHEKLVKMK